LRDLQRLVTTLRTTDPAPWESASTEQRGSARVGVRAD
jgi:hypothetical protein